MNEFLTAEEACIQRNEAGELLPIEATLDNLPNNPKIVFTPMTKGELQEIRTKTVDKTGTEETTRDIDEEVILKHLITPKFDEKTVKDLKVFYITSIVMTIVSHSVGISRKELTKVGRDKALLQFDEIVKKKQED